MTIKVEVAPHVVLMAARYGLNRATAAHNDSLDLIRRHADILRPYGQSIIRDLEYVLKFPHPALSDYELKATQDVLSRCRHEWE